MPVSMLLLQFVNQNIIISLNLPDSFNLRAVLAAKA